jgi:hypothetical protein
MILSGKMFVQGPDLVKGKIVSCSKEYKADHPLTNGQRAFNLLENITSGDPLSASTSIKTQN